MFMIHPVEFTEVILNIKHFLSHMWPELYRSHVDIVEMTDQLKFDVRTHRSYWYIDEIGEPDQTGWKGWKEEISGISNKSTSSSQFLTVGWGKNEAYVHNALETEHHAIQQGLSITSHGKPWHIPPRTLHFNVYKWQNHQKSVKLMIHRKIGHCLQNCIALTLWGIDAANINVTQYNKAQNVYNTYFLHLS